MKSYNDDSKKEISEKELEEIAGGKGEFKKGSAALMGSLMMLGGTPGVSASSTDIGSQKGSSFSKNWVVPAIAGGALTAVSAGAAIYALNNYLKHKDPAYCLELYFNSEDAQERNSIKTAFKNSLWKEWKNSSMRFTDYIIKLMEKIKNESAKKFLSLVFKDVSPDIEKNNFFEFIDDSFSKNINSNESDTKDKISEEKLLEFIKNPKISEAAEKAFNISNEAVNKDKNNDHMRAVDKLSSSNKWSKTEIEKIFDDACSKGDLPIGDYELKDLDNVYKSFSKEANGEEKFYFYKGLDALEIHNEKNIFSDGDVVNLASQFNAMESPFSSYVAPVKQWPYDRTQGPRCALQSIEACKHREAAHLQGKLTDAIKDVLDKCTASTGEKITDKYPSLYKNGYLEPDNIEDEKDLKKFRDFICDEKNIEKMKFLSQWVKCEGSGKMQLQVFSAAPNFGYFKNWVGKLSDRDKLLKECSSKLIEVQYKALAQVAAMRADVSGKRVGLHVTMIGNGVFSNPEDTIRVALKALEENLAGHNVDVYLHCYKDNIWKNYANELGINCEYLN